MASDKSKVVASLTVAAVAAGVLVALAEGDLGARAPTSRARLGESKLVELPDAGKGYAYPSDLDDGGMEYLVTDEAPYRRSLPDAGRCWLTGEDGGAVFPGDFNRFHVAQMHPSSTHCDGVAGSVVSGVDDPDEDEGVRLARERSKRP